MPTSAPHPLRPAVLGAVALGGAVGGLARWAVAGLVAGPWATVAVNVVGCALIGVLTAWLAHRPRRAAVLGPLLGVGLLGGFTTFSTWTADVVALVEDGATAAGLVNAVGLPLVAVGAVLVGGAVTRRALAARGATTSADGEAAR